MKRSPKLSMFMLLICLVTVTAIALIVPVSKTRAYWIAFAFFVISIFVGLDAAYYALKKGNKKSKFLHCDLYIIYWCYVLLQMICSLICMILASLSASQMMLISVILLVACQLFLVPSESTMQEETIKAVLNMRRKK